MVVLIDDEAGNVSLTTWDRVKTWLVFAAFVPIVWLVVQVYRVYQRVVEMVQ